MAQSDPGPRTERAHAHVLLFPSALGNQFLFPRVCGHPGDYSFELHSKKNNQSQDSPASMVTLSLIRSHFAGADFFWYFFASRTPAARRKAQIFAPERQLKSWRALKVTVTCLIIHPSHCCCWRKATSHPEFGRTEPRLKLQNVCEHLGI